MAVAIVITFAAAVPTYSQRNAGSPRLALDKPRHYFGETFAGEDLSHVFWVRNVGATVLELSEKPLLTTRPAKAVAADSFREPAWKLLAVKAMTGPPAPT